MRIHRALIWTDRWMIVDGHTDVGCGQLIVVRCGSSGSQVSICERNNEDLALEMVYILSYDCSNRASARVARTVMGEYTQMPSATVGKCAL